MPAEHAGGKVTDKVTVVEVPLKPLKPANGSGIPSSAQGDELTAVAPPISEPPPNPFAILWPAYLCSFIDFLGIGIAIPILPYYILELPWIEGTECPVCPQPEGLNATGFKCGEVEGCGTATEVGLSIAFFGLGQVIGNLIMSRASDRLGRKLIVMLSLLASSLGFLWCGLATTLTSILLARTCTGIFGGTLPVVQAMVLDTIGDQREKPKYFGIASATLGLGFMAGPAVGAAVGAISGSKRTAFFSPVIIASVCLCVALFKIKETKPGGGIFGDRHPLVDEIFDAGKTAFETHIREAKRRERQQSSDSNDSKNSIAVSNGAASIDVGVDGNSGSNNDKNNETNEALPKPKLPKVVFACAAAVVLAAMSFTSMTSMCGLVWLNLFNYGPTQLGLFLTGFGLISVIMNVCGVKTAIRTFGAASVITAACVLQAIGITGFTFIDVFPLHILYFVAFIGIGWSLTLPTMLFIAGEFTPPQIRGMATGMIAGSMSLGFAVSPLMSGPIFQSDVLKLEHMNGSFSHLFFIIAGVGFGLIELFIVCNFIVPTAKTLHREASKPGDKKKKNNVNNQNKKNKKQIPAAEANDMQVVTEIEI